MANTITNSHTSRRPRSFRHEPLDQSQPSIRLIEINLGLSAEGLVECHVSHTTIEATYTCLSYRWGDDDAFSSRTILMNGEAFIVRQNLFDFLHCVCTSPDASEDTSRKYWIDALCIHQSNISERNHQVAQMGKIFAGAERVHIWLGSTTPEDLRCIQTFFEGPNETMTLDAWKRAIRHDMLMLELNIFRNKYWTRAWVTQEILLAQSVLVQLSTQKVAWATMLERSRYCRADWIDTAYRRFATQQNDSIRTKSSSLLSLLSYFENRECSVIHDRIYSLLALCDERDIVPISYSTTAEQLAWKVLIQSDSLCFCTAATVAKELRLRESHLNREVYLNIEVEDFLVTWIDGFYWCWRGAIPGSWRCHPQGKCLFYWTTLLCENLGKYLDASTPMLSGVLSHHQASKEVRGDEFWTAAGYSRSRMSGALFGERSRRLCDLLQGVSEEDHTAPRRLTLAPGWRASVKDAQRNRCIVEVDLWAMGLSHPPRSLCSEARLGTELVITKVDLHRGPFFEEDLDFSSREDFHETKSNKI